MIERQNKQENKSLLEKARNPMAEFVYQLIRARKAVHDKVKF